MAPDPSGVTFLALAAAPYPTTLGTVTVAAPQTDAPTSASFLTATLALSDDAVPFAGLMRLTALIDGLPMARFSDMPAETASGVNLDVVCRTDGSGSGVGLDGCGAVTSVGPGAHAVMFSARIPGAPSIITSAPVAVSASCGSPTHATGGNDMVSSGGGCSLGGARSSRLTAAIIPVALALVSWRRRRRVAPR